MEPTNTPELLTTQFDNARATIILITRLLRISWPDRSRCCHETRHPIMPMFSRSVPSVSRSDRLWCNFSLPPPDMSDMGRKKLALTRVRVKDLDFIGGTRGDDL